jgi:polyvinyl alcohol dehydrogenase (cytochrome)
MRIGARASRLVALCAFVLLGAGVAPAGAASRSSAPNVQQAFPAWPTYHRTNQRTGYDPNTPAIGTLAQAWKATLDGAVYAEPLMVHGHVIAATENDTVYGLDPVSGHVQWTQHLATPVPLSQLPCGNIDPLGITGTPAFDPVTRRLFVVAESRITSTSVQHWLYALNPDTGAVLGSRQMDAPGSDAVAQQQRAALVVANGRVYAAYGGLAGDCSDYHGLVVASLTDLTGSLEHYSAVNLVSSAIRGGIWATSGPAVDQHGNILVAVGNGRSSAPFDYSDAVLKLDASTNLIDYFAPSEWAQDNAADLDLGSTGPAIVGRFVYADGKSGTAYLLKMKALGQIGGQLDSASVCASFGGTALLGTVLYVPCTDGIRAVDVGTGTIVVTWHTTQGTATGPPVVGGGAVWSLAISTGILYALNPSTGTVITSISVGPVEHFATPMLSGGDVFVPVSDGVVAVSGA